MNSKDVVKELMNTHGINNAKMSRMLGISTQACWDRLNNKKKNAMAVNTLSQMLNLMDYEVVIIPRGKSGRIDGAFVVEE